MATLVVTGARAAVGYACRRGGAEVAKAGVKEVAKTGAKQAAG